MTPHLLTTEDLAPDLLDRIRRSVSRSERGRRIDGDGGPVLGLVFMEPSLRTRTGFAAAAAHLGWATVTVDGLRSAPTTESLADTLRTVAGYVDVMVCRPAAPLGRNLVADLPAIVVNGGDTGPDAEHPTQALIDLCSIERFHGPVEDTTVALVGDLRMRSARSLLALFHRIPPRRLVLVSASPFTDPAPVTPPGVEVDHRAIMDLSDVDVLYAIGMPHESIPVDVRESLQVTPEVLSVLPRDAVVLSPMPVIDEVTTDARVDSRVRFFDQSDLGLDVRITLLRELVEPRH